MTALEKLLEYDLDANYIRLGAADDTSFDDCIIGTWEGRLVYSVSKILDVLIGEDEDEEGEKYMNAREHFDFNIGGSYIEGGPIYIEDEILAF